MTDITPGGAHGSATVAAINSSGQIVGEDGDGFLYTGGKITDLGTNIDPLAINDLGVIVGQGGQGPGGAIVGTAAGHFQSLQSLVPANSGFTLATAVGINDNGQIVVNGYNNTTGQGHAFVLTPN
jgi:probable HAF family extracellular repeat protein